MARDVWPARVHRVAKKDRYNLATKQQLRTGLLIQVLQPWHLHTDHFLSLPFLPSCNQVMEASTVTTSQSCGVKAQF